MSTRRNLTLIAAFGLLATPAAAEKVLASPSGKATAAGWTPAQATGPKDVAALGDSPNAWATQQADAGPEWLRLRYAEALPIKEIHIWQSDTPGAVARVTVTVDGAEVEVWKGVDPVATASKPVGKVVTLAKPYTSDTVTVHLDTARVSGWNEIDAVEVVAADGRRLWAVSATASSTYGSAVAASVHPLSHLVGKHVGVRADGMTVTGQVKAVADDWITLESAGKTVLVATEHAAVIEWRD